MTPLRFFELYTALTLHFKGSSYDFFRYKGKANVSEKSLMMNRAKYHFQKFASKFVHDEEAIGFIVSNLIEGNKYIVTFDYETYLTKWLKQKEAVFHTFECEYRTFKEAQLNHENGDTPLIVELGINNTISREFIILLDIAYNGKIFESLDAKNNILWDEELKKKCTMYRPFIQNYWGLDKEKVLKLRNIINQFV